MLQIIPTDAGLVVRVRGVPLSLVIVFVDGVTGALWVLGERVLRLVEAGEA